MIADSGPTWDIFCRVVDNYGDAGVCWRLARQLAGEYGLAVRLWCDDLGVLARMAPALDPSLDQQICDRVEIRRWSESGLSGAPADVVIEAFACEPPSDYVAAMAARKKPPVWLNLEYLSAESWVAECHLLPSPHPRLNLVKHFFFPGFGEGTGGLLRERDLMARCLQVLADPAAAWKSLGVSPPAAEEFSVSLFAYENDALPALVATWQEGTTPIRCLVRPGRSCEQLAKIIGRPGLLVPGECWRQGQLTVFALPFCPQQDFDTLLWLCDLNFVRGEDSFVRAQWAARPFVWHIYPQQDAAHDRKLDAFLERYCTGLPEVAASAIRRFWQAWNGGGEPAWDELLQHREIYAGHAVRWCDELAQSHDLAKNLVEFVRSRLK